MHFVLKGGLLCTRTRTIGTTSNGRTAAPDGTATSSSLAMIELVSVKNVSALKLNEDEGQTVLSIGMVLFVLP